MLFTQHLFSFEVTAFILLVAIIAAIAINLTLRERSLRQDPGKQILENKEVDLILLIGFMRILSSGFVERWHGKIINVHPSLLPKYAGGMNSDVHESVLAAGDKESGCTIHLVTKDVDCGPILLQKSCPVYENDSVESLRERVQKLEGESFIEVINNWRNYE